MSVEILFLYELVGVYICLTNPTFVYPFPAFVYQFHSCFVRGLSLKWQSVCQNMALVRILLTERLFPDNLKTLRTWLYPCGFAVRKF